MVKVFISDLFESNAQTLVNTVNTVGVMGKGIALEFKKRFPEMYTDYVSRCQKGKVKLGRPYLYKSKHPPWILNFPTKNHWRSVTRLSDLIAGMEYLLGNYEAWGMTSLAVPPLGCGQGQLEWEIVGPTLHHYLDKLQIPVELYAPYGTPHRQLQPEFLQQELKLTLHADDIPEPKRIKPGWIALVEILKRIEDQPYHRSVGRTIFLKIAYVATEEELPTGLKFRKGSYGPFSSELKQVITRLLNNGLISEEPDGPMFKIFVGPTFEDARKTYSDYLIEWESTIEKIVDLFMRIDTSQAEMVATVLFAAKVAQDKSKDLISERDVIDEVMGWKELRRPPLDVEKVSLTVRNLASLNWLRVNASNDLSVPSYIP